MNDLQKIYDSLNDNEKFGLSFGLFPFRLAELNLMNHEAAELIRMSKKDSGVIF